MKVSTMRNLDLLAGVPVCLVLTLARRLLAWLGSTSDSALQSIVFVKLAEQGSTVLACSAIRRAIELVGRDNVYFLVFDENRFILDVMELIPPENVITISSDRIVKTIPDAIRAIMRLRKLRIDAAVDLEFFARSSAALCFLSGATRRAGFHAYGGEGPYRGDLMTHRLRFNPYLHTSQTYRMMVEALSAPREVLPTFNCLPVSDDEPPPHFRPCRDEIEEAKRIIQKAAGKESFEPLLLLNPNCSDLLPLRRWPAERYVQLALRLLDRYPDVHIAMTGSPPEEPAVGAIVERVGSSRCFSLAGKTTLRQLLVVYGLAEILVTSDSGPAHFASLTDIDVVTLFGPETPRLFASPSERNHVIWEGIVCSPCVSALNNRTSPCRNNVCLQRIEVDKVFETVCRIYDAKVGGTT